MVEAKNDQDGILELVVKNPYTHRTFSCSVATKTTVYEIKRLLEESYSGRPKPKNQRLVFFGKIHPDDATLGRIFKGQDLSKPQTCHLIISGGSLDVKEAPKSNATPTPKRAESAPTSQASENQAARPVEPTRQMTLDTTGLVEQVQQHRVLFQQQLTGAPGLSSISRLQSLGLEAQVDFNSVAGGLGSFISYGVSGSATSGSPATPGQSQQARNSFKWDEPISSETEQNPKDTGASSTSDRATTAKQELNLDEQIVKLEQAYQQLVRTLVVSQQFHAISNPLLFTPQPVWTGVRASYGENGGAGSGERSNAGAADMNPHAANQHARGVQVPAAAEAANRNHVGNGVPGDVHAQPDNVRVVRRVYVINIRLILKLAFLLYLVGNDASYTKMMWFCAGALLYYLHEMGCFRTILGTDFSVTGIAERMGQERLLQIPPASDEFNRLSTDATTVVKSFVLSLLPSWHVQPYAEEAESVAAE